VLSRRRKMLMDMADGIEIELREQVPKELLPVALRILSKALEWGPYKHTPEWFNNDDNFAKVMQETLYLQRMLINEVSGLNAAIDKPELKLKGWTARGPARIPLLIGWLHARTSIEHVFIDLRECELTPQEGEQLGHLMAAHSILNAIDVRGNESLGDQGATALADFMAASKVRSANSEPRSINGVTHKSSSLQVPKQLSHVECRLLCAELESNIFAEGVSAGMGQENKKGTTTLNRRGGSASASWAPLLWAAKDNNLVVAEMLIDKGHDVNKQESLANKGLSGYAALHWAAHKGHLQMCELLLSRGANPVMNDKHNNTAQQLAEKKGEKEIVTLLESYISGTPATGGGKQAANKGANKGKAATKGKAPAKQADAGGGPSLFEKPAGPPSLFADAVDPMLES